MSIVVYVSVCVCVCACCCINYSTFDRIERERARQRSIEQQKMTRTQYKKKYGSSIKIIIAAINLLCLVIQLTIMEFIKVNMRPVLLVKYDECEKKRKRRDAKSLGPGSWTQTRKLKCEYKSPVQIIRYIECSQLTSSSPITFANSSLSSFVLFNETTKRQLSI